MKGAAGFTRASLAISSALVLLGALSASCALAQSAEDFGNITRPVAATARPRTTTPEPSRSPSRVQEVSAPPGQPGALGGVSESTGYFVCADYDQANQRCRVRALSAEQRESALKTGIEVAQYGMRIQEEARLRVQNGAANAGANPFETCIADAMRSASAGARPTPAQQARIFQNCSR